jgi:hypothetical protein
MKPAFKQQEKMGFLAWRVQQRLEITGPAPFVLELSLDRTTVWAEPTCLRIQNSNAWCPLPLVLGKTAGSAPAVVVSVCLKVWNTGPARYCKAKGSDLHWAAACTSCDLVSFFALYWWGAIQLNWYCIIKYVIRFLKIMKSNTHSVLFTYHRLIYF